MTDYRKDFPLLSEIGENTVDGREWIYIDNAATSQRPQCVIDAERDFYLKHNANPLRGNYPLSVEATELYENARKGVRDFIGAKSAREIIFTRNTTESMNLVAYSYGLNNVNAGDEILVSIMEHHSNLLPWQMVARQTGAVLRFIECRTDGSVDLDQVKEQPAEKPASTMNTTGITLGKICSNIIVNLASTVSTLQVCSVYNKLRKRLPSQVPKVL